MEEFKTEGIISLGNDLLKKSQEWIYATSVNMEETIKVIQNVHETNQYLVDPHTAVGIGAIGKLKDQHLIDGSKPVVCLATAHACKFSEAIKKAIQIDPKPPGNMQSMSSMETKVVVLSKDKAEAALRNMVIASDKAKQK